MILGFLHSSQPLQSQQTQVPNGLQISVAGQLGSLTDTHRQMGLDIGSLVVVITSVVVVSKSSSVSGVVPSTFSSSSNSSDEVFSSIGLALKIARKVQNNQDKK